MIDENKLLKFIEKLLNLSQEEITLKYPEYFDSRQPVPCSAVYSIHNGHITIFAKHNILKGGFSEPPELLVILVGKPDTLNKVSQILSNTKDVKFLLRDNQLIVSKGDKEAWQ